MMGFQNYNSHDRSERYAAYDFAYSSLKSLPKNDIFFVYGDNDTYPTNPAGPTMFGYKGTEHEDLVKAFFEFVCTPDSLQEILDNSPSYTNLDVNVDIQQNWLPEEEEFMATVDKTKMATSVLQTGTKYTNDYWMDFGADMVSFCQGTMEANDVLKNMDTNRAEDAKTAGDTAWK